MTDTDVLSETIKERDSLVLLVQDLAHELLQIEANCPCGARPETIETHPHASGCHVAAGLDKWESWAVPKPEPVVRSETRTACGFCVGGLYRGRRCPYCDGTGDAPQERAGVDGG